MRQTFEQARTWTVDYSAARAQAIRWLGDRYLLAKPINRKAYAARPSAPAALDPRKTAGRP